MKYCLSTFGGSAVEALATYVSLVNANFMDQFTTTRDDQAFINLSLFWEHCGGSGGSVGQTPRLNWMKQMVASFETYVNTLHTASGSALSELIQKSGTNTRFFVFNPLSWTRTDVADIPYSGTTPLHVVDISTGQDVPSQIVSLNQVNYIRLLASDVPSVGYKVYEIRSGTGTIFPSVVTTNGGTIENNLYKITVAERGAITSLIDKQRASREFAKTQNNKVINDLGPTTNGTLTVENSGVVSATLLASSSSPVNHTSRVTLYRDINRIDIQNDINQNFTTTALWGYGFNLTNPEVNYEEIGAVIRARLANDSSKPGQYSPRSANTRYDYLTLNHFAAITGNEGGVTLSNWDVDFMKLGASTLGNLDVATPQLSPVAGGDLGSGESYSGQGGSNHFLQRFSLQTHSSYNQTQAMKFSLEHQNPLVTGLITGTNPSYPETNFSLLSISDPDVLLWALKPAEEGISEGIITRVWNMANTSKVPTLSFPTRSVTSSINTTHIETDLASENVINGSLQTSVNKYQMNLPYTHRSSRPLILSYSYFTYHSLTNSHPYTNSNPCSRRRNWRWSC